MTPLLRLLLCVAAVVMCVHCDAGGGAGGKSFNVSLETPWDHTPLLLEAGEFFAHHEEPRFWAFLQALASGKQAPDASSSSDLSQYEYVMQHAAATGLSKTLSTFLRVSLASRQFSPRVHMYRTLGAELYAALTSSSSKQDAADCPLAYAVLGSKVYCDVDTLLKDINEPFDVTLVEGEHVIPRHGIASLPTVILVADPSQPLFRAAHPTLYAAATADPPTLAYVYRPYPPTMGGRKVQLQGWGAELRLKSTEYKVIDDEDAAKQDSSEEGSQLAPITKADLKGLGYKASQVLMSSKQPLQDMAKISQNLPTESSSFASIKQDEAITKLLQEGQGTRYLPGQTMVLLNGRHLNVDNVDVYKMMDIIAEESGKMESLRSLGLTSDSALSLLALSTSTASNVVYNVDSPHIMWVSNVETNPMFKQLSPTLTSLTKPSPRGIRPVKRNLINVVVVIDPTDLNSLGFVHRVNSMLARGMPIRVGLLFSPPPEQVDTETSAAHVISQLVTTISELHGAQNAIIDFLSKLAMLMSHNEAMRATPDLVWQTVNLMSNVVNEEEVRDYASEGSDRLRTAYEWLTKTFKDTYETPHIYVNGALKLHSEVDLVRQLMDSFGVVLNDAAVLVSRGELDDDVQDLHKWMLNRPGVLPSHMPLVFPSPSSPLRFASVLGPSANSFMESLHFFTPPEHSDALQTLSYVLACDFSSLPCLQQAAALADRISESDSAVGVRVAFADGGAGSPVADAVLTLAGQSSSKSALPAMRDLLQKAISRSLDDTDWAGELDALVQQHGCSAAALKATREALPKLRSTQRSWLSLQLPDSSARNLLLNGRIITLPPTEPTWDTSNLMVLEHFESQQRAERVAAVVDEARFINVDPDALTSAYRSDVVMKVVSQLGADLAAGQNKFSFPELNETFRFEPPVNVDVDADVVDPDLDFEVVGILDPLSRSAQRFSTLLGSLANAFRARLRLRLNPLPNLEEIPLKEYYRYVVVTEPSFGPDGNLLADPYTASFEDLPSAVLLSTNIDAPDAWVVEPLAAPHDLDNLMMSKVADPQGLSARFSLKHVLIEGNCFAPDGRPPRGLELSLSSPSGKRMTDTLVMENLGYWQLKASPGLWAVQLPVGSRSAELYTWKDASEPAALPVTVQSFAGAKMSLVVAKRPGMESEALLGREDRPEPVKKQPAEGEGLWAKVSSLLGGGGKGQQQEEQAAKTSPEEADDAITTESVEKDETVHVFSLATGHLYERFLRMMIVSVRRHTERPVKLWVLENFLSPDFKRSLPRLAKHYGFDFELVTYRWPRWLRAQSEKQRIIWGYKILFLDVLFPLDLQRIIFVDADQIVREDLGKLMDMDLEGAPYGYTPFCDSRKETSKKSSWCKLLCSLA